MRIAGIAGFYPAHPSNYQAGRGGRSIKYFTVHHTAGFESTLRYLWANANRGASSTFFAGQGYYEQYVDTSDTPFTNGNFVSNQESITCETRGDWRGYYDQSTLNTLEELMYQCLKVWPHLILTYHQDVSSVYTLCPADLKNKGYALQAWNRAKARLNAPAPTPTPIPSKITYERITPKRVEVTKQLANLWDFNFTEWSQAKAIKAFNLGDTIDVVAIATNARGGKYYMTAYSYNEGNIRATNGINVADVKDYVAPTPIPTPPKPTPEVPNPPAPIVFVPLENPRKLRTGRDLRVIDLTTKTEIGDVIKAGTDVDIVDKTTLTDNKLYFRSKWAQTNGKLWGLPADSLVELPEAPEVPVEPVPETPIDTDPTTPGNGDVEVRLSALEKIVKAIVDFLSGLFSGFKVK